MRGPKHEEPASLKRVLWSLVLVLLVGVGAWLLGKYCFTTDAYKQGLLGFGGLLLAIGTAFVAVAGARDVRGKAKRYLELFGVPLNVVGALFVGAAGLLVF